MAHGGTAGQFLAKVRRGPRGCAPSGAEIVACARAYAETGRGERPPGGQGALSENSLRSGGQAALGPSKRCPTLIAVPATTGALVGIHEMLPEKTAW